MVVEIAGGAGPVRTMPAYAPMNFQTGIENLQVMIPAASILRGAPRCMW